MTDRFETAVDLLIGEKPPKVWSLLITVFGELAQGEDQEISGLLLSRLTKMMRVRPEANRVALHRLRKDGWLESRKSGRNSYYALTARGRAETASASPRIYGEKASADLAWLWLIGPTTLADEDSRACTFVSSDIALATRPAQGPDVASLPVHEVAALPDWIKAQLCTEALLALGADVRDAFSEVVAMELQGAVLDATQIAVLRVLIVHGWRRIILRTPELPDELLPDRLELRLIRDLKSELLRCLPSDGLAALEG
ncbi:PaaX family transcriptional regulator C-terminal domain-containing protein [Flavimaricola marinus]|uniref:Transcriptional repressor PaaX n=1 Tax=Flavimaricola marinus TaxID=1819565 RepID=A0A238LKV2_9RHOB|nr:PaaX family transcriptional regulator C-terminal domain-containing protein [Flavimaricola marinus]SMY10024.1 Transcriptional repressor PaaX [Flavimaricola marinus]